MLVNRKMGNAATELKEFLARIAIALVLGDGIANPRSANTFFVPRTIRTRGSVFWFPIGIVIGLSGLLCLRPNRSRPLSFHLLTFSATFRHEVIRSATSRSSTSRAPSYSVRFRIS